MHFTLEKDADGWPPVAAETIWVRRLGDDLFQVDNVPFFVKLIAYHDRVEGDFEGNLLNFRRLAQPSGYATVRVIYNDPEKRDQLMQQLEKVGCEIEGAEQYSLLAIGIPPGKSIESAMSIIRDGHEKGWWDYEEGCLPAKPRRGLWSLFKKA